MEKIETKAEEPKTGEDEKADEEEAKEEESTAVFILITSFLVFESMLFVCYICFVHIDAGWFTRSGSKIWWRERGKSITELFISYSWNMLFYVKR